MNVCGTTRLLVPAFLVGLAVATFVGNDLYGWIAAALTLGALAAVGAIRGTNQSCAYVPPPAPGSTTVGDTTSGALAADQRP